MVIADDSASVRDRFRIAVESAGHRAIAVKSAAELFARVRADLDRLDLLVIDLRLPHCSGAELIRTVRKLDEGRLPILAFSGTVSSADEVRDRPVERVLMRAVHDRHPAEPEHPLDPVRAEGRAGDEHGAVPRAGHALDHAVGILAGREPRDKLDEARPLAADVALLDGDRSEGARHDADTRRHHRQHRAGFERDLRGHAVRDEPRSAQKQRQERAPAPTRIRAAEAQDEEQKRLHRR